MILIFAWPDWVSIQCSYKYGQVCNTGLKCYNTNLYHIIMTNIYDREISPFAKAPLIYIVHAFLQYVVCWLIYIMWTFCIVRYINNTVCSHFLTVVKKKTYSDKAYHLIIGKKSKTRVVELLYSFVSNLNDVLE